MQTGFINKGVGWFGTTIDNNLYIRCMQASGYSLQASRTAQPSQAAQAAEASATTGDTSRGRSIYNGKGTCFACHGLDGDIEKITNNVRGKWSLLNPKPSDFKKPDTLKLKTDKERFQAIKFGIQGTAMVPMPVSDDEITDVLAYLAVIRAQATTEPLVQPTQSDQTALQGNSEKRLVYPAVTGFGPINGDTIEKYDVVAVLNFTDAPSAPSSGKIAATILSSLLGDTGVILLERSRIEQVFEEQRLQLTSADEKVNQLKVGKLAGAKALVVGDVDLWQSNGQASNVSLSIRMVDVETGSVLFSGVGYWPAPVKGPPQAAVQKILLGLILKLSSKIGTGTGAVGVAFDMREDHGAHIFFVRKVLPGWPGEAAGLKSGDVILTCNGTPTEKLKTKLQFTKACHADGGQSMSLEVARGNQRLLIKATAIELFKGL